MKKKFVVCFIFFQMIACSHSAPKKVMQLFSPQKAAPKFDHFPNCQSPRLSPDGRQLLALCTDPSRHLSRQIYLFDLQKKSSRRVTWQDGNINEAIWFEDNHMIYTSTTDEVKESLFRVDLSASEEKRDDNTEIYLSDLFGNHIERLTNHPGPDQELNLQGTELSYVSVDHGKRRLLRMNVNNRHGIQEVFGLPVAKMRNAIPLANKQWVWLEQKNTPAEMSLQIFGKSPAPTALPVGLKWLKKMTSENGLLLNSKQNAEQTVISWVPENLQCVKQIYQTPEEIQSGDLSEKSGLLALTVSDSNQKYIELIPLDPNSLTCATMTSRDSLNP